MNTIHTLRSRLLSANALEARSIWKEAKELGVTEGLKRLLAVGVRSAPHGLSDEC